jgi:hypothetical protein
MRWRHQHRQRQFARLVLQLVEMPGSQRDEVVHMRLVLQPVKRDEAVSAGFSLCSVPLETTCMPFGTWQITSLVKRSFG